MKNQQIFLPIAIVFTLLFYGLWWNSSLIGDLDNKFYDVISGIHQSPPDEHHTLIVTIDEKSLEHLGQWPWPRIVLSQLINKISDSYPASIALDIIFPEPDRTSPKVMQRFYLDFFGLDSKISGLPNTLSDNDELLSRSLRRSNTTLALYFDPSESVDGKCSLPASSSIIRDRSDFTNLYESPHLLCNLEQLQKSAHGAGHIQASVDNDGILRSVPLFIRHKDYLIPTLGLSAISTVDTIENITSTWNRDMKLDVLNQTIYADSHSQSLLTLYPQKWYHQVSALDVLEGKIDPKVFHGKFVLIGVTAMGLHDHYTFSDGTMRPGIFAHATLIENIFNNSLRVQPSLLKELETVLSVFSAIILLLLMRFRKYIHIVIFITFGLLTSVLLSYIALRFNIYISAGYYIFPLVSYIFVLSLAMFLLYYRDQKRFFEKMTKANNAIISSMALVAETRDTDTGAHIIRTKKYVQLLASYLASKGYYRDVLTKEYITDLYHAAPLHDIGKVGIPDDILKKPAKLSVEEFEIMKTHPTIGKEIIANAMKEYNGTMMLPIALNIAYSHHEKWDGSGYPNGLKGEDIPLEARMMAVADVYDALISRRCYKNEFSFEEAENVIINGREKHFDPLVVDSFVAIKEQFRLIAEQINNETAHLHS